MGLFKFVYCGNVVNSVVCGAGFGFLVAISVYLLVVACCFSLFVVCLVKCCWLLIWCVGVVICLFDCGWSCLFCWWFCVFGVVLFCLIVIVAVPFMVLIVCDLEVLWRLLCW